MSVIYYICHFYLIDGRHGGDTMSVIYYICHFYLIDGRCGLFFCFLLILWVDGNPCNFVDKLLTKVEEAMLYFLASAVVLTFGLILTLISAVHIVVMPLILALMLPRLNLLIAMLKFIE